MAGAYSLLVLMSLRTKKELRKKREGREKSNKRFLPFFLSLSRVSAKKEKESEEIRKKEIRRQEERGKELGKGERIKVL